MSTFWMVPVLQENTWCGLAAAGSLIPNGVGSYPRQLLVFETVGSVRHVLTRQLGISRLFREVTRARIFHEPDDWLQLGYEMQASVGNDKPRL